MKYFLIVINFLGPFLSLVGTYCVILSCNKYHEIEYAIKNGIKAEGKVMKMQEDLSIIDDTVVGYKFF